MFPGRPAKPVASRSGFPRPVRTRTRRSGRPGESRFEPPKRRQLWRTERSRRTGWRERASGSPRREWDGRTITHRKRRFELRCHLPLSVGLAIIAYRDTRFRGVIQYEPIESLTGAPGVPGGNRCSSRVGMGGDSGAAGLSGGGSGPKEVGDKHETAPRFLSRPSDQRCSCWCCKQRSNVQSQEQKVKL